MNVGVKYCGGCNPLFDRSALVSQLENALTGIQFGSVGEANDYVLIVCGCLRACVSHGHLTGRMGKIIISNRDDYAIVLKEILNELERDI